MLHARMVPSPFASSNIHRSDPRLSRWAAAIAAAACIFFCLAGMTFLPRLGVQNDEALFTGAIYQPDGAIYSLEVGNVQIALDADELPGHAESMALPAGAESLGAQPLDSPNARAARGASTVWLFFLLLRRIAGAPAAVFGEPASGDRSAVSAHHLSRLGSCRFAASFTRVRRGISSRFCFTGSWKPLAGGFLLFGLAMWDKALFTGTFRADLRHPDSLSSRNSGACSPRRRMIVVAARLRTGAPCRCSVQRE